MSILDDYPRIISGREVSGNKGASYPCPPWELPSAATGGVYETHRVDIIKWTLGALLAYAVLILGAMRFLVG